MNNVVFIVGITPRSGTNYLYEALALHPKCKKSRVQGEDFVLYNSDLLIKYIHETYGKNKFWNHEIDPLKKSIENGLLGYLAHDQGALSEDQIILCKTPHTAGLKNFLTLFNSSKIIIIVRRGQDASESWIKTWGGRYDWIIRKWNKGAESIRKFQTEKQNQEGNRFMIIRYEDLYQSGNQIIEKLLDFCSLDKESYDFEALKKLAVFGSSTFNNGNLTWDPIAKTDSFNPLNRSDGWSIFLQWRFDWIAGKSSRSWGYTVVNNFKLNPLYYIYNVSADTYEALYSRTILKLRKRYGRLPSVIADWECIKPETTS